MTRPTGTAEVLMCCANNLPKPQSLLQARLDVYNFVGVSAHDSLTMLLVYVTMY